MLWGENDGLSVFKWANTQSSESLIPDVVREAFSAMQ